MAAAVTSPAAEPVRPHGAPTGSEHIKEASLRGADLSPTSSCSHYFSPANQAFRFPAAPLSATPTLPSSSILPQQAPAAEQFNESSNGCSPVDWVICPEESTPPALTPEKPADLKSEASFESGQTLKSTTSSGSGEDVDTDFSATQTLSKSQKSNTQDEDFFPDREEAKGASSIAAVLAIKLADFQQSTVDKKKLCSPAVGATAFHSGLTWTTIVSSGALPAQVLQADATQQQHTPRQQQQQQPQQQQQRSQQQHQVGAGLACPPCEGKPYYGNSSEERGRKKNVGGIFGRPVPSRRCQWLRALPVVFLMVLVAYILAVFITYHILPELQLNVPDYLKNASKYNRGLIELAFTGITTFLFLVAYWLSVITSPGSIPNTPEWQASADTSALADKGATALETKKTGERRHCKWCRMLKPDRAHHCRVCRSCVLKMDHHCPWIYNCVGYKNHKYFLLSLIYGSLASLIIACCMLPSVREASDSEKDFEKMFMLLFAETLDIFLCVLITGFLVFHLHLLRKGMTTIEFCEKQFKTPQSGSTESMWNKGAVMNFIDAFGPNPLLWFIPIDNREGDGVTFLSEQTRLLHEEAEATRGVRAFEPIIEGYPE